MARVAKAPAPKVKPAYEFVSPAEAARLLNFNKSNRKLRTGLAEKYAKDMSEGKWTTCTAPIVIYDDGNIADGQHRLFAVVESGIGQWFLILKGLDRPSGLNIDMNWPRGLIDNARISGLDTGLSHALLSYTRGIEEGDRASTSLTNTDRLAFVAKHREAAEFAVKHGGKGKLVQNAMVNCAVGRAWYYEADKARLEQFGVVLSKGFANGDQDSAAISLRNYIMSRGAGSHTSPMWRDIFIKAQNAVWYFMRGRRLMAIKGISEERYPLKKGKK